MILERDTAFHDYRVWINTGGHYSREVLNKHIVPSMRKDAGDTKSDGTGRWRPSMIADPCDRAITLSFLGESSGFEGNWYTWSGTWLHLAFQTYLLDNYPQQVRIEVPLRPKVRHLGVTGKADWVWSGEGARNGMVAIKGPHVGDFKSIATLNHVLEAPKEAHRLQLAYEMLTLRIDTAYLVYQSRAHGDMVTWRLEMEPGDRKPMLERLARLERGAREAELPPVLFECLSQTGPMYRECKFSSACMRRAVEEGE